MKSYKCCGFLIVFLLVMLQNVSAQNPDFSKMTPKVIQKWAAKKVTRGININNLVLNPYQIDTGATTVSFEYHEDWTFQEADMHDHYIAAIIGSAVAAPIYYSPHKIEVRTVTSPTYIANGVDNKLTGNMTYSGINNECSVTGASQGIFTFFFSYDSLTKMGQIECSAGFIRKVAKCTKASGEKIGGSNVEDAIKGGAHNDVTLWKLPGVDHVNPNTYGDEKLGFFKMEKVGSKYNITYSNTSTKDNVTIIRSLKASIGFKPEHLEAILKPVNKTEYTKWIPAGPLSSGGKGNSISFKVELRDKVTGAILTNKETSVEYFLSKISTNPGVCLNYPLTNANNEPDLEFDPSYQNDPLFTIHTSDHLKSIPQLNIIPQALINSKDFASYGKLSAKITCDGFVYNAVTEDGKDSLTIPFDYNDNHIADQWEKDSGILSKNYPATWDDETSDGNTNNGDGITLYEEYRGLIKDQKHICLSPVQKDVVMLDKTTLNIKNYMGLFQRASGFKVTVLKPGELDETSMLVNYLKSDFFNGPQHAIKVKQEDLSGNDIGVSGAGARCISTDLQNDNVAASPKYVDRISVSNGTDLSLLEWIMAHETAHGLGVKHHGDQLPTILTKGSNAPDSLCLVNKISVCHYMHINEQGVSITPSVFYVENIVNSLGQMVKIRTQEFHKQGDPGCGDARCIMCYTNVAYFAIPLGMDASVIVHLVPGNYPNGTTFCKDKLSTRKVKINGTDVPLYGDAKEGKCKSQFKIKDY